MKVTSKAKTKAKNKNALEISPVVLAVVFGGLISSNSFAADAPRMNMTFDLKDHSFQEEVDLTFAPQVQLGSVVQSLTQPDYVKVLDATVFEMQIDGTSGPGHTYNVETSTKKYMFTASVVESCTEALAQSPDSSSVWTRSCHVLPDLKQGSWAFVSGNKDLSCSSKPGISVSCALKFAGVTKDFRKLVVSISGREFAVSGVKETLNYYGSIFEYLNQGAPLSSARQVYENSSAKQLESTLETQLAGFVDDRYSSQTVHAQGDVAHLGDISVKAFP